MLTSKLVYEGVTSVLVSLKDLDLEGAKKKLEAISPEARNERERGSILAATGIYSSISKAKEGSMQSWTSDRVERAAISIRQSQMADEFDAGYADTLMDFSKLMQSGRST